MKLKTYLKKVEDRIKPPDQKTKTWLLRTNYGVKGIKDLESIKDLEDKEKTQAIIQEIKAGNVQHRNGNYYQEGDIFILLSRIFTDKKPDDIDEKKPVHVFDFGKNDRPFSGS